MAKDQGLSSGQELLHSKGVRQGCAIQCKNVPQEYRDSWIANRPSKKYRDSKKKKDLIEDDDLLVVLSQDCDIACKEDSLDEMVELALLKPIDAKIVYKGNKFTQSVRTLHTEINGQFYEAKVQLIVWAKKEDLLLCLNANQIQVIGSEYQRTLIFSRWRSNRYDRVALPDNFNATFLPLCAKLLDQIDSYECIAGLYIWLDSVEEREKYEFRFFALLKTDTPDEVAAEVSDHIEYFCDDLGAAEHLKDASDFYAARMDAITLDQFTKYLKVNAEHLSLASGDEELGPATRI